MTDKVGRYENVYCDDSMYVYIVKSFLHPVNYHIYCIFIYINFVRTFKLYSLRKFQWYNTMLSTIVIMLNIRSSYFTALIAESMCPFMTQSFPRPPALGNHHSTLCIRVWHFLFFKIPHISDTMQHLPLSVWLISLNVMFWRPFCIVTNGSTFFFLMAE